MFSTINRSTASLRLRILRIVTLAALLGVLVSMSNVRPAAAGLTERTCRGFTTGDSTRMLSVCSRGWVDATGRTTRAVVEMHTYVWSPGYPGGWADSVSKSITLNRAAYENGRELQEIWGNDGNEGKCRVNGPAGRVACSVPNTARVAFYSAWWNLDVNNWNDVWIVSWRDDRGQPHRVTHNTHPDRIPIKAYWS